MIIAIVPAAGKSERMGQPKLLMPLGDRRVIEHVLGALERSPIDRTVVVIPPGAAELATIVRPFSRVELVELQSQTADMRASVEAAIDRVTARMPRLPQAFLLALADQPTVAPDVVRCLVEVFQQRQPKITLPTYRGKRGHPVLFSWQLIDSLRALPGDQGINALVEQLAPDVVECPIDDERVLADLDTPFDYEKLRRDWNSEKRS